MTKQTKRSSKKSNGNAKNTSKQVGDKLLKSVRGGVGLPSTSVLAARKKKGL
jgi:hypothetical protein